MSVCDFYTFVYHIKRGLLSNRSLIELFADCVLLRRRMFTARLGATLLFPSEFSPRFSASVLGRGSLANIGKSMEQPPLSVTTAQSRSSDETSRGHVRNISLGTLSPTTSLDAVDELNAPLLFASEASLLAMPDRSSDATHPLEPGIAAGNESFQPLGESL